MCLQGIVSGVIFVACILYAAYHHLSQYPGGLGISSCSKEPHHGQLSWFLPLFAFACEVCMARLYGALVGLGSGVRMGTWGRPRVKPEFNLGWRGILLFLLFTFIGFWHKRTSLILCFANVHGWST